MPENTPPPPNLEPLPRFCSNSQIAGFERVKLRRLLKRYYEEENMSIRDLADKINRSFGFVRDLLDEADTPLRPRGGQVKRASKQDEGEGERACEVD